MKKSIKRTTAAIIALATTAGVAGSTSLALNGNVETDSHTRVVKADTATAKNCTLTVDKYENKVKLYSEFTMPTAKFIDILGVEQNVLSYKVKSPMGADINTSTGKFKVEEIGKYTITYIYGSYETEVSFLSEMSTYTLKKVENTSKLLPAKVSTNYVGKINLPEFKVVDEDGEEVEGAQVTVTVKAPDYSAVSVTDGAIEFNGDMVEGYYVIDYVAKDADGKYLASTNLEFNAVKDSSFENEYELKLAFASETIKSVNVGETKTLPSVTAKHGTESVPVYYEVKVYRNGGAEPIAEDAKVGNTDKLVLTKNENGAYEFTANEIGGYYRVVYTVKDALGNTKQTEFTIDTVEDKLKPTPMVVEVYDSANEAELKNLKNVDYKLKSVFGNEKVVILPIYANDLATFNHTDYKFERRIENSSREVLYTSTKLEDASKEIVFNKAEGETLAGNQIDAGVTLKDGTYNVVYKVTDANGNEQSTTYKFVVDKNLDWTAVEPTVEFKDNFKPSVEKGEKVKFKSIVAKDEKDERVEVVVSYKYDDGAEQVLEKDENGDYVIDTSKAVAGATKLTILAKAINDGGKEKVEEKVITLKSIDMGIHTPTVYDVEEKSGYSYSYNQGAKITLPTIVFEDDADGVAGLNVKTEIKCKTSSGTVLDYTLQNGAVVKVGNYLRYQNADFVASTAGDYQVSIKATDIAGNVVVKFLDYTVTPSSAVGTLKFKDLGLVDTTIELGDTHQLLQAVIAGENADDYGYYVTCTSASGDYELNNDEFTPHAVGEYKLKYVMYEKTNPNNTMDDLSREFTIKVEDTEGPEVNLVWETERVNDNVTKQTISSSYDKGTKILIPKVSASDISGIDFEKSTIVISSSKTTRTIKLVDMINEYDKGKDGDMFYSFNNDAEYTVTYTIYDKVGNSSKVSKTIKIGDLVAPVLKVDDKIVEKTYKAGQILSIDLADTLNYIEVSDNKNTDLSKNDVSVKLFLNGKEIEKMNTSTATKFNFELKDAGEYELKFEVKDDANLTSTVTKTFTIQDKSGEAMTTNEIIGTVLIVVSVAVLAGVVVYFIISKRKMDKLYKG